MKISNKKIILSIVLVLPTLALPTVFVSCSQNAISENEKEFNKQVEDFSAENITFFPLDNFNPLLTIKKAELLENSDFLKLNFDSDKIEINPIKSYIKENKFWIDFYLKKYDFKNNKLLAKTKSLSFNIANNVIKNSQENQPTIYETILYNKKNNQESKVSYKPGIHPEIWNIFINSQNLINNSNKNIKRLPMIHVDKIKQKSVLEAFADSAIIERSQSFKFDGSLDFTNVVEDADFSENDSRVAIFEMLIYPTNYSPEIKRIIEEHDDKTKNNLVNYTQLLELKYSIKTEPIFNYASASDIDTHKSKNQQIGAKLITNIDSSWLNPFLLINKKMYFWNKDKKPSIADVISWNKKEPIFGNPIWFAKIYNGRKISFSINEVIDNGDSENIKITININIGKDKFMDNSNTYIRYFNIRTCLFSLEPQITELARSINKKEIKVNKKQNRDKKNPIIKK